MDYIYVGVSEGMPRTEFEHWWPAGCLLLSHSYVFLVLHSVDLYNGHYLKAEYFIYES